MTDADRYFQTLAVPGSLFYHPPREAHVASFDEQNPFKPSYLWLVSQTVPAANQNRRRFVHSLAALGFAGDRRTAGGRCRWARRTRSAT